MTPTELAAIKVPTLIIQVCPAIYYASYPKSGALQADKNPLFPMQNAEDLRDALVNVPGSAVIFSVKGMTLVPHGS